EEEQRQEEEELRRAEEAARALQDEASDSFAYTAPGIKPKPGEPGSPENPISHEPDPNPFIGLGADETDGFTSDSSPESPFGINPEALDGLEETRDAQAKANEEVLSQLDTELDQNQGQRDTGRKKARRVEAEAAGREAIASIIGNARLQAGQVSISSETGMQTVSEAREQALEDRVRTELRSEQAELLLEHGDRGRGLFGTGKDEAAYAALALMQGETVEADIPASALIPELIDEELTADPSLSPEQRAQEFRENLGTSFVSTQERLRESQASLETMRAELNDPSTSLTRREELTDQMLATRVEQEKLTMRAETLSQVHSRVTKLINAGNIDEVLKIQDDSAGALVGLNFNQDNRTEILARGLDISANPAELQAYRESLGSTIQTAQTNLDRASTVQERNRLARQFELHDQLTQALDQADHQTALTAITDEHGYTINPLDPPGANKPAPLDIATRALSQTTVERARTQIAELETEIKSDRDSFLDFDRTAAEEQAKYQGELAAIDQEIETIEARPVPTMNIGIKGTHIIEDQQVLRKKNEDLIAAHKRRADLISKREAELEEDRKARAELLSERTESLVRFEQARELMSKGDYAAALQVANSQAQERNEDFHLTLNIEDRTGFPDRSGLRPEAQAAHEHRDDVNATLTLSQEQFRTRQGQLELLREEIASPRTPEAIRAARIAQYETLSLETEAQARALDQGLQYQARLTELVESGQYDEVIRLKNGEASFESQAQYGERPNSLYQRVNETQMQLTRAEAEVDARRLFHEAISLGEDLKTMQEGLKAEGLASLKTSKTAALLSYSGWHVRATTFEDAKNELSASNILQTKHTRLERARQKALGELGTGQYHQARTTLRQAMREVILAKQETKAKLSKHFSSTAGEAERRIDASFESAKNTIAGAGTAYLVMSSGGAALPLLMAGGVGMGSSYAMDLGYSYGDKKDLGKAVDYANSKIGQNAKTVGLSMASTLTGMGSSKLAISALKNPWAKAALSRLAPKAQELLSAGLVKSAAGLGEALPGAIDDISSRVAQRAELSESLKARGYSQVEIDAEIKKYKLDNDSITEFAMINFGSSLASSVTGTSNNGTRPLASTLIREGLGELTGLTIAGVETSLTVDPDSPEYIDTLVNNIAGSGINRALGASAVRDLNQRRPELKIEVDESLDPDTPAQTRIEVDANGKERAIIAMHPSYRQRLIDADPAALQGISADLQRAIDQSRSQRPETENLSPEEASLRASETLFEEEYHAQQEARVDPIKRGWTGRRQKDPNSPTGYKTMSEGEYNSRRSLGEFEAEQYGQVKAREALLADARARGDQQTVTRLESEIAESRRTYDERRTILQDHINNGRWEAALSFAKANGITEADLQNYRADYEHNTKADRPSFRQRSNSIIDNFEAALNEGKVETAQQTLDNPATLEQNLETLTELQTFAEAFELDTTTVDREIRRRNLLTDNLDSRVKQLLETRPNNETEIQLRQILLDNSPENPNARLREVLLDTSTDATKSNLREALLNTSTDGDNTRLREILLNNKNLSSDETKIRDGLLDSDRRIQKLAERALLQSAEEKRETALRILKGDQAVAKQIIDIQKLLIANGGGLIFELEATERVRKRLDSIKLLKDERGQDLDIKNDSDVHNLFTDSYNTASIKALETRLKQRAQDAKNAEIRDLKEKAKKAEDEGDKAEAKKYRKKAADKQNSNSNRDYIGDLHEFRTSLALEQALESKLIKSFITAENVSGRSGPAGSTGLDALGIDTVIVLDGEHVTVAQVKSSPGGVEANYRDQKPYYDMKKGKRHLITRQDNNAFDASGKSLTDLKGILLSPRELIVPASSLATKPIR
ncbi:MAG: hypothetical protein OXU45_09130, partial [Candidatus Melainabacteria bacterium]|nr:hypothetical protein [Candidatus Melainabacteria bacterium]